MRAALLQMTSGDDPQDNLAQALDMMRQAADQGARFVLTPEVTNCLSPNGAHQRAVLRLERDDQTLPALQQAAADAGVWLLIGSLALKTEESDGRFANRSFLIAPDGGIAARYDKIHMFDVQVSENETYHESKRFRPGDRAVTAQTDFAMLGLTVCYDIRFPYLYRTLAQAGAQILTVPAAFSPVTGAAHWEPMLRTRAIETGCFVLAPAQSGTHPTRHGTPRRTHGHSMVVAPWGEVLLDAGTEPGVYIVDLDLAQVADARARVPSLTHDRSFGGPDV